MKTQRFLLDGEYHMIDEGGNHFVGYRCVNPKSYEGSIGDSYPPVEGRAQTLNS